MKRIGSYILLLSAAFCTVAVARFAWVTFGPGSWGPRFLCTEAGTDFGELPTGGTVEHDFAVRNTGRKPLHILNALPSCGRCLAVSVSKQEIAPQDSATVKVVLDVTTLEPGPMKNAVLLETDDPDLKKVVLYVMGRAH